MSLTSQNALQTLSDDPSKPSTCPCRNPVTETMPFPNTPGITENVDVPELEDGLIAEQQYEKKSVQSLQNEVDQLKIQLAEAESKLNRSLFRLENVRHDKHLLKFYTGFSSYETLIAFYEEMLEEDALLMWQWSGKRSECDYSDVKAGPPCKLPLKEQLFLTFVRLRTGFPELDIANRFGISQSTVSQVAFEVVDLV